MAIKTTYFILFSIFSTTCLAENTQLPTIDIVAPVYISENFENKSGINLHDMPSSIQVVKPEIIQQQGITNMTDALRNVSGIQPADGGMANDFRARGLGVTFFRDNIFDGNAQNSYYRSLVDVQEIEVQKGPGSALFGSSAPGASINLVTKKPQRDFALNTGASYGSFATRNAFADVTGEIAKGAAGRLIVNTEASNGYRGLDRELIEILPSISFDLAENRTLLMDVDYRKSQITPDNYGIPFNFNRNIANVDIKNRYYTPFANVEQTVVRSSAEHDWHINDALQMKTTLVFDTRDLDILRNVRGNAQNAAGRLIRRSLRQQFDDADYLTLQNELLWDVKTGDVAHKVLAGLAYSNMRIDTLRNGLQLQSITNINNPVVPETSIVGLPRDESRSFDRKIKSDTYSIYVQDQMTLNPQWKLRAGLRNDHVNASDKGIEGTLGYRNIHYNKDLLSGSLGLVYQPKSQISFYGNYSKGAFNNINTKVSQISTQPETARQFEIGSKFTSAFADVNVAIFHIKRDNYLFDLPEAENTNDGKDTSRGIEFDIALRPFAGLTLSGNAVFLDAEVKTDVLANLNALGISDQSTKNTEPVGVSRRVYSAWANYALQNLPGLTFGLGATHRSSTYADALNQYQVPSFIVLDASARYKFTDNYANWTIGLFVKNLTNKEYFTTTTNIGAVPGDERSALLNISYQYK